MFLRLRALLGLNTSGFELGLKRSKNAAEKWSKDVSGTVKGQIAAAFGAAAIVGAMKSAIDYGGKINDLSTRLGISTDALQEFDYAASQTGGSLDAVTGALQKLAVARAAALDNPDGDIAHSFKALGVAADDLKSKRLEDLLKQISGAFQSSANPQALIADGMKVMGKSAGELFPMMIEGFADAADAAQKLGIVISEDTISNLDDLGDQLDTLKAQGRSFVAEYGGKILEMFNKTARAVQWATSGVGAFYAALAEGVSVDEAGKVAREVADETIAAQVQQDITVKTQRANKRERATKDISEALAGIGTGSKTAKASAVDSPLDSLARIGGFAQGATGKETILQQRIAKATEETARNTGQNAMPRFYG